MVKLEGDRVVLRPFRPDEFEVVWQAREGLAQSALPVRPPERERLRRRIERSGRLREGELDLAIEVEGRLAGQIQTYRPPERPLPRGVYEIGIVLFDAADRGRGYGSEAMSLLTEWLFDRMGAVRVQASTSVENAVMRHVLEKLGYGFDEAVRDFDEDYALYAVSRIEWVSPA